MKVDEFQQVSECVEMCVEVCEDVCAEVFVRVDGAHGDARRDGEDDDGDDGEGGDATGALRRQSAEKATARAAKPPPYQPQ